MDGNGNSRVSPLRLRIGVLLILLWWIPFWALAPFVADILNVSAATLTTVIIIIQTLIGFIGIFLAGKEVAGLIKSNPKKQALKTIWYVLIHGHTQKPL